MNRLRTGHAVATWKLRPLAAALCWGMACVAGPGAGPENAGGTAMGGADADVLMVGGCGGVYLLASPGELVVEVTKRDRQAARPVAVRAILFGPDRAVLEDRWIEAAAADAVQSLRLSTEVTAPGVYGLMITAADDRYGTRMTWGFRTNCPRYMIETARGHRDARHEEPLVLASPERAGEVCFLPRRAALTIEVAGVPAAAGPISCVNACGDVLATLTPDADGRASYSFAAAAERTTTPWRLQFPRFQGEVNIDGVTRWDTTDDYPGLSLWTPAPNSWFALHEHRWLLTPYRRTVFAQPGVERELTFRVHHNGLAAAAVALAIEFPDGQPWPVTLSTPRLELAPRQAADVGVCLRVPDAGTAWSCRLRATCGDVSTYSTINLVRGDAPALSPMPIPLTLKPFQHENELFGYLPGYPLTNQPYFDVSNRPFVAAGRALRVLRDDAWTDAGAPALAAGVEGALRGTKLAFDADNDAYCLATLDGRPALLHSADGGANFTACPVPGNGHFDLENFSGHNLPTAPPAFVRVTRTAKDPKLIWRSLNDVHLFAPEKQDGKIILGEPVLVTALGIGISDHSGIPSSLVSRGAKVHLAWGEATDPKDNVPGVPTYVATYDRQTRTLGKPVLVGYGPPANDVHNSPCITMDSQGFLHVLVGTHGRTFKYARSLQPNDSAGGWTPTEDVGLGLSQTYIGLVCAPDDTLHMVFRLWQQHGERFPAGSYACLAHMSKRPGEPWSAPRPLIVAPFTDYSVFYHRLTIDRRGRLFLSYEYWSTYWFYRTDHVGRRRALLTSADNGVNWRLAADADLAP